MNTVVTSKEEILAACRRLIQQQGWSAVNIRSVAAACGVSVGSIYNYFDSKAALICAAVESIWFEIFHQSEDGTTFQDILTCIVWIYERMEYGGNQYPGFFSLHALGFLSEENSAGRQKMQQIWQHILDELCAVLKQDTRIRPDAFTEDFTAEDFSDALFSWMLSAFLRQDYTPDTVLEIVRRTLY